MFGREQSTENKTITKQHVSRPVSSVMATLTTCHFNNSCGKTPEHTVGSCCQSLCLQVQFVIQDAVFNSNVN